MDRSGERKRPLRDDPGSSRVGPVAVACLGEALVMLPAQSPHDSRCWSPAGAEANVAVGLVGMGVPAACVGRLGDDELGAFLRHELASRGVDLRAVQLDSTRPTGAYVKEQVTDESGEPQTRMRYRRAGSAASAMGPGLLDDPGIDAVLSHAEVIHTSGITAALSPSCLELMRALLQGRPYGATICFDVNWREQLWPDGDPSAVVDLAAAADVVLVGGDEAERVFGTTDTDRLRELLPRPRWVVVKDGARRAIAVGVDGRTVEQPALAVEVVEPVGAGDAFAAGLIAGIVRGEEMRRCLRLGHLSAASVLTVVHDSAPLPPADLVGAMLDASGDAWAGARVTARGFALAGDQAR